MLRGVSRTRIHRGGLCRHARTARTIETVGVRSLEKFVYNLGFKSTIGTTTNPAEEKEKVGIFPEGASFGRQIEIVLVLYGTLCQFTCVTL